MVWRLGEKSEGENIDFDILASFEIEEDFSLIFSKVIDEGSDSESIYSVI